MDPLIAGGSTHNRSRNPPTVRGILFFESAYMPSRMPAP